MNGIRIAPDKNLRFICAQPATNYYIWQVETLINNFMEMGVNPNNIDIVCWKQNGVIPDNWNTLRNHYNYVRFFFYDDTRETKHYISSIRPNILKQHWANHPYLESEAVFYHDSDIVFTKPIGEWITTEMINDNHWYGSDTRWYIAHSYILSKGQEVMDLMCQIMKLPEDLIKENELNAIGAQYLMKGVDAHYWERVERDCEQLFKVITELNNRLKGENPTYHELQIWCADMWAVLWGAWRRGYKTLCSDAFDFSWGTSNETEYWRCNIMHNAGVTSAEGGLFYKPQFMNELPYGKSLDIKADTASRKYWEWIQKTGEKSCLL